MPAGYRTQVEAVHRYLQQHPVGSAADLKEVVHLSWPPAGCCRLRPRSVAILAAGHLLALEGCWQMAAGCRKALAGSPADPKEAVHRSWLLVECCCLWPKLVAAGLAGHLLAREGCCHQPQEGCRPPRAGSAAGLKEAARQSCPAVLEGRHRLEVWRRSGAEALKLSQAEPAAAPGQAARQWLLPAGCCRLWPCLVAARPPRHLVAQAAHLS